MPGSFLALGARSSPWERVRPPSQGRTLVSLGQVALWATAQLWPSLPRAFPAEIPHPPPLGSRWGEGPSALEFFMIWGWPDPGGSATLCCGFSPMAVLRRGHWKIIPSQLEDVVHLLPGRQFGADQAGAARALAPSAFPPPTITTALGTRL